MEPLTLYVGNRNYSSWSLRPWLALKQTGAAFAEVVIPLDQAGSKAAIGAQSPSGRVPLLVHGELRIWESLAICEYVAELFPAARLWPADGAARAVARAVSCEMHAGFATLRRQLPMDIRNRRAAPAQRAAAAADIARVTDLWHDCRSRFGAAAANGPGPFLFGGFSIADAMFAPVATRFVTYDVPLAAEPAAYVAALCDWPAMRTWRAAAAAEPWTIEDDVFAATPA
ncbi:MAG: glutathione S-transferase [Dongiaceae bacterium]